MPVTPEWKRIRVDVDGRVFIRRDEVIPGGGDVFEPFGWLVMSRDSGMVGVDPDPGKLEDLGDPVPLEKLCRD